MNGAEIALVAGLRVRVGSGADCDIVLADASLAETAFELDVTPETVSFIRGEETKTLTPYEIFEVGTSGFAIGPADAPWAELRRPKAAAPDSGEATSPSLQDDATPPAADAPAAAESSPHREEGAAAPSDEEEASRPQRSHGLFGLLVVLLLLLVIAFVLWLLWPKVAEKCPAAEQARVCCQERVKSWYEASKTWIAGKVGGKSKRTDLPAAPRMTLAEIASMHGLVLTNYPLSSIHYPLLRGNVARRTERLAIRALAQSVDPQVKFDLTDDESLAVAANELLFVVTEGALKVTAASNRVVTVAGYAPSAASLERTIRALDADVKGIERVLTKGVTVGGTPPPKADAPKAVFQEVKPTEKAARSAGTKVNPARDFPIAGILTKPYPTVVMNNGMRLAEGAQLGNAVIERIESDRLVLRNGATTFEWKP